MGLPIETKDNQNGFPWQTRSLCAHRSNSEPILTRQLFSKREIRVDKSKCELIDEGEWKYLKRTDSFKTWTTFE
jgi:hypothetical protein